MIDLKRLREYAEHGRLSIDPKVILELLDMLEAAQDDSKRLDAMQDGCCDIRCEAHSEDSYGWAVYEHHMAQPTLRKIGESFRELGLREAIDAAKRS